MHKWNKYLLFVLFALAQLPLLAQEKSMTAKSEGLMRSEGKIYVVLAVVLTILVGLIIYMTRLDRKISNVEKGGH
ncbi:MAG: CcmD family protein [Segetibacter sp.]|nr:CcmD family protein [Segetibacter sp.]